MTKTQAKDANETAKTAPTKANNPAAKTAGEDTANNKAAPATATPAEGKATTAAVANNESKSQAKTSKKTKADKAEKPSGPSVIIYSAIEGFRRCGMAHPKSEVTHEPGTFTAEQIKILEAEPNLNVRLADG